MPGVRGQYMSDYWSAVDYNPLQKQDSYVMWDADLSFYSANDMFERDCVHQQHR